MTTTKHQTFKLLEKTMPRVSSSDCLSSRAWSWNVTKYTNNNHSTIELNNYNTTRHQRFKMLVAVCDIAK